jgi:hypothetical protein
MRHKSVRFLQPDADEKLVLLSHIAMDSLAVETNDRECSLVYTLRDDSFQLHDFRICKGLHQPCSLSLVPRCRISPSKETAIDALGVSQTPSFLAELEKLSA